MPEEQLERFWPEVLASLPSERADQAKVMREWEPSMAELWARAATEVLIANQTQRSQITKDSEGPLQIRNLAAPKDRVLATKILEEIEAIWLVEEDPLIIDVLRLRKALNVPHLEGSREEEVQRRPISAHPQEDFKEEENRIQREATNDPHLKDSREEEAHNQRRVTALLLSAHLQRTALLEEETLDLLLITEEEREATQDQLSLLVHRQSKLTEEAKEAAGEATLDQLLQ